MSSLAATALRRPPELALNPLRRSRVAAVGGEDLAAVLQQAVYELAQEQGGHGPHQAAVTAFMTRSRDQPCASASGRTKA